MCLSWVYINLYVPYIFVLPNFSSLLHPFFCTLYASILQLSPPSFLLTFLPFICTSFSGGEFATISVAFLNPTIMKKWPYTLKIAAYHQKTHYSKIVAFSLHFEEKRICRYIYFSRNKYHKYIKAFMTNNIRR